MRRASLICAVILATACAGKKKADEGAAPPGSASGSAAGTATAPTPPTPPPPAVDAAAPTAPAAACTETNQVAFTFAAGTTSPLPAAGFQLASSLAFARADAAGTGTTTTIVFGNYAVRDTFGPSSTVSYNPPAQAGEAALSLVFATAQPLAAGDYPAGAQTPGAFDVRLELGGVANLSTFSDQGKATITVATATQLCGSFETHDDAGATVKGSFNLPLADHHAGRGP